MKSHVDWYYLNLINLTNRPIFFYSLRENIVNLFIYFHKIYIFKFLAIMRILFRYYVI